MGFDHRRGKKHENQDTMWTSYSDLFLGLSVVFLLLFVSASLRQGTDGLKQFLENKNLQQQNEDLQQQLKIYNSLKQAYLNQQASDDEQEVYQNLMSKLELLQEEANEEQKQLMQQAAEHEQKEQALNQYQQIVRNIINANLVAKARIKNRDVVITDKENVIEERSKEIVVLQKDLDSKRRDVARGERKIADLQDSLQDNLDKLEIAYRENKITRTRFQQQQSKLREEAERKIADLKTNNEKTAQELASLSQELNETQKELAETSAEKTGLQAQIEKLKSEHGKQAAAERAKFQSQLKKERLSAKEQARRQEAFRLRTQEKERELADKIAGIQGQYQSAKSDLVRTKADLAKAHENLNAKKKLAQDIMKKFAARGVKADVDPGTGDVLLSFEGEYFDTGKSKLKPGMRNVLERAMPAYAQSLFQDPKIADKIENVEIVGFASPTFQGKYVDPSKLSVKDRGAVNFNLDLSYNRAKSIFDHMFTNMDFKHKQRLLPLLKVTGRSFLDTREKRNVAASEGESMCDKMDCAKQQTVIIKFKLRD